MVSSHQTLILKCAAFIFQIAGWTSSPSVVLPSIVAVGGGRRRRSVSRWVTVRHLKGPQHPSGDGGLLMWWLQPPSNMAFLDYAAQPRLFPCELKRRQRLPDSPGRSLSLVTSLSWWARCWRGSSSLPNQPSCCTDQPWTSCGRCRCPCWRRASPSPWMRRRGATACSPASPSPCACARGCPTTPPSCPTYWTITTSKRPPSPWRYGTLLTCETCEKLGFFKAAVWVTWKTRLRGTGQGCSDFVLTSLYQRQCFLPVVRWRKLAF